MVSTSLVRYDFFFEVDDSHICRMCVTDDASTNIF